jgi:molybdenum ABC transporter molybdate-binding protein
MPAVSVQDKVITVFAAASLKNALDDINKAFGQRTGAKVTVSYAASPALIKQIEHGAPADVFVSADLDWMDYGSQKGVIKDETRINLLGNRLVLIAPKDSQLENVVIAQNFNLRRSHTRASNMGVAEGQSARSSDYRQSTRLTKTEVNRDLCPNSDTGSLRSEGPVGSTVASPALWREVRRCPALSRLVLI